MHKPCANMVYRGVARGEAGEEGLCPPPRTLAAQLTLFEPGWADFAPHTTASPPGFKKLSTPLYIIFVTTQSQFKIEKKMFLGPSLFDL